MGRTASGVALFVKPGSAVQWCRFSVGGKQYKLSTGERDHDAALAKAEKLRAERVLSIQPQQKLQLPKDDGQTLLVLSAKFVAWMIAQGKAPSYTKAIEKHFRAHILTRWSKLYELTTAALAKYPVERTAQKASSVTIYKEQVTLSRFLQWCKLQGLIATLPEITFVTKRTTYQPPNLTPDNIKKLLSEIPDRAHHPKRRPARELYQFVWAQALRIGEAMTLRWCNVDLKAKTITIVPIHDKGRKGRTLPLSKEALVILKQLEKKPHKPEELVFGRGNYRRTLALAAERAKLPKITPHHLRHARLSQLASKTKNVAAVQYFAGHASLATTSIYVRSKTEQAAEMLKEL